MIRELSCGEIANLEECLKALSAHHNEVSVNFKGYYPKKPFRETLASFGQDVRDGKARIGVAEKNGRIIGFCKADLSGTDGAIAYLIVLKEFRGMGYGDRLLEWGLDSLKERGARCIEVRVVDGNSAEKFYERHGFRVCSHILRMDP